MRFPLRTPLFLVLALSSLGLSSRAFAINGTLSAGYPVWFEPTPFTLVNGLDGSYPSGISEMGDLFLKFVSRWHLRATLEVPVLSDAVRLGVATDFIWYMDFESDRTPFDAGHLSYALMPIVRLFPGAGHFSVGGGAGFVRAIQRYGGKDRVAESTWGWQAFAGYFFGASRGFLIEASYQRGETKELPTFESVSLRAGFGF